MFDLSWGDGGITIGWGNNTGGYPVNYPGTFPGSTLPYYPPQHTTISNGMLLLGALVLYLVFSKK